ncbi:MAG: radical SAM protein, partial [Deltaproteobacteria bacterium]|nr:radical SAM protein [Deltaproteobacteria bacterium]
MHEALFYEKCADNTVICRLCPHECKISGGKKGLCRVRQNIDGTLHSQVYGKCIAENADPIEKKPLFHCQPGSRSYSMATVGCNMRCKHCQNADISQMPNDRGIIMGSDLTPEDIVSGAKRTDCASISYTYTEPTIYFEYMHATAQIAHAA